MNANPENSIAFFNIQNSLLQQNYAEFSKN